MYVNFGPQVCTVGAEVASVVKIEHHYTAFSKSGLTFFTVSGKTMMVVLT
jgi:hypothetical protein